MARIIRFPLKMSNGTEVRTLEELQENFDLQSILGYFADGKLLTWLESRYYDEAAEKVSALSADMPDLNAKLCEILGVEYQQEEEVDLEYIQRRNEKKRIIADITADKNVLDNIDAVALNQDDLFDALDNAPELVYLYGEKYSIPFGVKNIRYIGLNNPLVILEGAKKVEDYQKDNITFQNTRFEKKAAYPYPVGDFEIIDNVLVDGSPDQNGVCIISEGVTTIGDSAFSGCTSLADITIPDSVTTIGGSAFEWCTSLTSITIPDSITTIGHNAFSDCTSLTSITIPDSVTTIGECAFQDCKSLTSITIPDSITTIGEWAFKGCTSLASITIPDSVTTIGEWAFQDCKSLTSITIPDSITTIEKCMFQFCTSLTSITIPDSVTTIGAYAFHKCKSLTSIMIPDSVTTIGWSAFEGCTSLTSITIPDSVTTIGGYAFYECTSLTSVILPNNIKIDSGAFRGTPWGKRNGIGQ